MAKIIVVEGPDKVGKETQTRMLVASLNSEGKKAIRVEVPYNDNFSYRLVYWMLRSGYAKTYPGLFQWVQFMNKRIFERFTLPKLERENDFVVFDRWSLSALIYGFATGVSRLECEEQFARLRKPDATIILMGRALSDKKDDAYEKDSYIQRRVRELYTDWAVNNVDNGCRMIHASGNRGEVHLNIVDALKDVGVL